MKRIDFHNALIALGFRNVTKSGTEYLGDGESSVYFIAKDEMYLQVYEKLVSIPPSGVIITSDVSRIIINFSDAYDGHEGTIHCVRGVVAETIEDLNKELISVSIDFLKKVLDEKHRMQRIEDDIVNLQLKIQGNNVQNPLNNASTIKAPELSESDKVLKQLFELVATKYGGSFAAYYAEIMKNKKSAIDKDDSEVPFLKLAKGMVDCLNEKPY